MFSCLDRSERAQMAALPIEEKADELIQEERAIGEVQLEQLGHQGAEAHERADSSHGGGCGSYCS